MNETLKTLTTRRSVRAYLPDQVKEDDLRQILEAGTYAPTGMGAQSPVMVVVQDPETLRQLSRMNAAASLGVASCWIHRAREVFDTPEGKELLKKWGLSDSYIGVGNCILGYAKDPLPQPKPRKENYIIRA